ncbi:MAG: Rnase Y domain-containing protein, partial [Planctomycetota bacterium]
MDWLPYGLGGLVLGGGLVWLYGFLLKADAKSKAKLLLDEGQRQADAAIRDAELKAREVQVNAQAEIERQRSAARDEAHQQNKSLDKRQTQLEQQAEDLKKPEAIVKATHNRLRTKLETATQREKDLNEIFEKQRQQLQRITGLDQAEATKRLLKLLEDELTSEVGEKVQAFERKLKETTEERAREVVLMAMQRCAAHVTAESTTSTVDIPNDEMKGRIIGREGRNIRAFEKETGVDLIIDDTPGVVIVSSFDPVRREVARMSLERLIDDGRIHPSRIEEIVKD